MTTRITASTRIAVPQMTVQVRHMCRNLGTWSQSSSQDWLDPRWFRFGASSLLNDLLMQRTKLATGRYSGPDYFTVD